MHRSFVVRLKTLNSVLWMCFWMNYADFYIGHCTQPTLSSCLVHSNRINQERTIAFVNIHRYSLQRCTKMCFLSSGIIIASLCFFHSLFVSPYKRSHTCISITSIFAIAHCDKCNAMQLACREKWIKKRLNKDLNGFFLKYFLCNLTLICAYLKTSNKTS